MALSNAWEQYFAECEVIAENNRVAVARKFEEVEAYHEKELTKVYPDSGVVFTRHEESLKDGYFVIWIGGASITHKTIKLAECGIAPLQLEDRPIRPDRY